MSLGSEQRFAATTKFILNPRIALKRTDDGVMLYDPKTRQYYKLDKIESQLLEFILNNDSVKAILDHLQSEFGGEELNVLEKLETLAHREVIFPV